MTLIGKPSAAQQIALWPTQAIRAIGRRDPFTIPLNAGLYCQRGSLTTAAYCQVVLAVNLIVNGSNVPGFQKVSLVSDLSIIIEVTTTHALNVNFELRIRCARPPWP